MTNSTLVIQDNFLRDPSTNAEQHECRVSVSVPSSSSTPTSPSKPRNHATKAIGESPRKLSVNKKVKISSLIRVFKKIDICDAVTSLEIKTSLCSKASCFRPSDILVVSGGRELHDDERISNNACVMLRSSVDVAVELDVSYNKVLHRVSLRSNMKVFQVKRALQAVTKVPPSGMRLILGGVTLDNDAVLLGDFLLQALSQKKRLSIALHKVLDAKKDVDLSIAYDNGMEPLRVSIELGQRLEVLPQLLFRAYGVSTTFDYIFAMKAADGSVVPLHPSMTLIELGVAGGASVELSMYRYEPRSPVELAGAFARIVTLQKRPERTKQVAKQASRRGLFAGMKRGFLSPNKK